MCFNQKGDISNVKNGYLESVDKFTGSSISSIENDISMWLAKAWTAMNSLSHIRKSNLSNKITHNFFQAVKYAKLTTLVKGDLKASFSIATTLRFGEGANLFQAVVMSILLYGCTTWMLTKHIEKKLNRNCTRMLQAILNKFWKLHPTKFQQYGHLPPISKTIQIRWTKHVGHC